jgi:hypothetical protein
VPDLNRIVKATSLREIAQRLLSPEPPPAGFSWGTLLVVADMTAPPGVSRQYGILRRGEHIDTLIVDMEESTVDEVDDLLELWERGRPECHHPEGAGCNFCDPPGQRRGVYGGDPEVDPVDAHARCESE